MADPLRESAALAAQVSANEAPYRARAAGMGIPEAIEGFGVGQSLVARQQQMGLAAREALMREAQHEMQLADYQLRANLSMQELQLRQQQAATRAAEVEVDRIERAAARERDKENDEFRRNATLVSMPPTPIPGDSENFYVWELNDRGQRERRKVPLTDYRVQEALRPGIESKAEIKRDEAAAEQSRAQAESYRALAQQREESGGIVGLRGNVTLNMVDTTIERIEKQIEVARQSMTPNRLSGIEVTEEQRQAAQKRIDQLTRDLDDAEQARRAALTQIGQGGASFTGTTRVQKSSSDRSVDSGGNAGSGMLSGLFEFGKLATMRRRDQFMATGFRGFPSDMQEALVMHVNSLGADADRFLRGVAAMLESAEQARMPAPTALHNMLEALSAAPEDARQGIIDTILSLGGEQQ